MYKGGLKTNNVDQRECEFKMASATLARCGARPRNRKEAQRRNKGIRRIVSEITCAEPGGVLVRISGCAVTVDRVAGV